VRIWIAADPPRPTEVQVEVKAAGLRASVLQRLVGLEGELKRFVATYVSRELEKPHVRTARMIDVSDVIATAWASLEQHRYDRSDPAGQGRSGTDPIPRTETDESP
jgi:hypothetical protein